MVIRFDHRWCVFQGCPNLITPTGDQEYLFAEVRAVHLIYGDEADGQRL